MNTQNVFMITKNVQRNQSQENFYKYNSKIHWKKIITIKVTRQNEGVYETIRIITRVSYQKKNKNSTHKKRHEVKRNSKIIEEKSKDSMRNWKLSKLCFYFFPYF